MFSSKQLLLRSHFFIIGLCFCTQALLAQNTPGNLRETYLTPPDDIAEQVLAPRYKNIFLSDLGPKRKYFVNYTRKGNFTPVAQYAKFFYNLGGLEIDPAANRKRTLTNQMPGYRNGGSGNGLLLTNAKTGETRTIRVPAGTHISNVKWSPDGSKLAYFVHFKDATYIYITNIGNGKSKRVTQSPVLATLNTSFDWSSDGTYIYTVLVPKDRGSEPVKPGVDGPQVRMTTTKYNRLRTYLYLLKNPYQVKLLKYYITGQLVRINVDNEQAHKIGDPAMIQDIDASPNGKYVMVTTLDTPFSYIVPVSRFGWTKKVWDLNGENLATLQQSETNIGIPHHNERKYKDRSRIEWRPDGDGLSMIVRSEGEDKSDNSSSGKNDKEGRKYQIVQWTAPFDQNSQEVVYASNHPINSVSYGEHTNILFFWQNDSGENHLYAVYSEDPGTRYLLYTDTTSSGSGFRRSRQAVLVKKTSGTGLPVVQLSSDNQSVFLKSTQYYEDPQKESPRPYVNRVTIKSGKKNRIFQSSADAYEQVVTSLDDDMNEIVVNSQAAKVFPNFYLVDTKSGQKTKLTTNEDYNEPLTDAQRYRFKVERPDGFKFWIEVILPGNWNGQPLPGLIWHYPTEYDSQDAYDKAKGRYNKNLFPRLRNHGWPERAPEILIREGYAVIKADWPIYSKRGGPNDAFVYSVRQNSTAIVDSIVSKGYVDRNRIAIGGHSYGGFGTINALVHTSLFKAGIAGDANSNRILTPLGFQREPRDLWRGRARYIQMSPIIWANRLDGALLMYSGADDQNVGTAPFMSWQLFHALNAMGKTAALYMYPYSQHHTNAKEIVLDRWTRWVEWLNHYVKNEGENVPETGLGGN